MTERVRRRTSKWDLPEEPDAFPNGSWEDNASYGKGNESIHEIGSKQNWNSSRSTASRNSNSAYKSEGDRRPNWETPSGNRAEYKDDYVSRDFTEVPRNSRTWGGGNRSYSRSPSPPGRDNWRHRSRSRSPKRSWSKSHRSRSRSPPYRSRSRSPPYGLRSRSPARRSPAHRRDSGSVPEENWGNNRNERGRAHNNEKRDYPRDDLSHGDDSQRSIRSTGICMNFLKGSCHRGPSCRFIHEDPVVDGHGSSEKVHDRDRKSYSGHDQRRDSFKFTEPCRYFAAGHCRKGTDCMFPHEGVVPDGPRGGSDRWGRRGAENTSWHDPKWNSAEATDSAHVPGRVANTAWGGDSGWNNKPGTWTDTADVNVGLEAMPGDERWDRSLADVNKSWGAPKWDEKTGLVNETQLNQTANHITNKRSDDTNHYKQFPSSKWNDKGSADIPGEKSEESKSWEASKWTNEATDAVHGSVEARSVNDTSTGWNTQPTGATTYTVVTEPPVHVGNGEQMNNKDENEVLGDAEWSDNAMASEKTNTNNGVEIQNNSATFSAPLSNVQEARKDQYPRFTYGIQDPQSQPQEVSVLSHEQTTTTQAYPLPSPKLRAFDLNGPSEDAPSQVPVPQAPQNVVTSEQVAQISHISASLAQIFGNRQQLPQLYATLNSTNPMGLPHPAPPSGPSNDGPFVQSTQNTWAQKQYDPVSSGIGTSQINIEPTRPNNMGLPHSNDGPFVQSSQNTWAQKQYDPVSSSIGTSQINVEPTNMGDHESQIPPQAQTIEPPSVVGSANQKAQEDGGADEDGRKGKDKDTKGVRMFKFALVEFVKEILKPIWKEGQLSKEAHKTVVKKVVDKVTTTVPEDHIPQTQDKIDQYLAYSKNKLTKLVEAYVEKFSKI